MRDANRREFGRQTFPRARARRRIDDRSQSKPRDARDEDAVAADEGRAGGGAVESERRRRRVRPSIAGARLRGTHRGGRFRGAHRRGDARRGGDVRAARDERSRGSQREAERRGEPRRRLLRRRPARTRLDGGEQVLASVAARTPSGAMVTASRSGVVAAAASAANVA